MQQVKIHSRNLQYITFTDTDVDGKAHLCVNANVGKAFAEKTNMKYAGILVVALLHDSICLRRGVTCMRLNQTGIADLFFGLYVASQVNS